MKEKTGVLIHGCHLQVARWWQIAWGEPPNLLGRLPKGVLVALKENAQVIVFGTGASEIDGKKEAEYSRDYLIDYFCELTNFSAFQGIDLHRARKKIKKISIVDVRAQNTAEEVKFAGQIFKEAGVEKIILVSSPVHILRCLKEAYMAFNRDESLKGFTRNLFASPSQTGWADISEVLIKEPPHRPDR